MLEFIEGGGLEKSHARQIQEEQEQRRMPKADLPSGAWAEQPAAQSGGVDLIGAFEALINRFR